MPERPLDRNLDRLIDLLMENATVVLSGTRIASQLRVPQSTLWEWMERLREAGAEVRGLPGSGYQLVKVPDILTSATLRRNLHDGKFGCHVHHFYKIDSTMNEAGRLAAGGAPHGTLVLAEEQTAGRGRFGRTWFSERSAGIYLTLILRPELSPSAAPILTLLAGVALAEVLQESSGLPMDLRWPNDVLTNGKKCAGILVEMTAEPERIAYVLVGIGVNVNHERIPEDLAAEATSLRLEAGHTFSRLEILILGVKRLEHYYNRLLEEGAGAIVERFSQISSYACGKRVRVSDGAQTLTGVTAGLTPEGILLVRRHDGRTEKVLSGHVRPER
ncbi:MAG: biotin--[acetyl-CoA-carboxylase] ligase [Acidobacteria bacterium]|nr:biotin--[acetyl-CoA-carboxylase] ligase [Acidobacteriota bacterium]